MRLLNVHTLQFRDFYSIPENYIVTSHRWSADNEAMLADVKNGQHTDSTGYKKVEGFARFVRNNFPHIDWLWIDTCCVNQESDREVSEAVNSMFRWYSQAELCLAYMADVTGAADDDEFSRSEWFHRGWTLQELLAPQVVVFLSQDWEIIGCKSRTTTKSGFKLRNLGTVVSISFEIAAITNIPQGVLIDYARSKDYNIDTKFGWMAGRETTREEDMIYSLFGIFDVTLPVIYGETAERAKRRLLKEIAETSGPQELNERSHNGSRQPSSQVSDVHSSSREESRERAPILLTDPSHGQDTGDNEDILTIDIADAALANGDDAFQHGDYYNADLQYRELLELIGRLSSGYRQRFDLLTIQYLLAVLVKTGQLKNAASSCKAAYHEQREVLGKDTLECYESLALLSKIQRLIGDEREAERCLSVIPKDMQSSMWEKFTGLWPPVQLQWNGSKPITTTDMSLLHHQCMAFSHDSRIFACVKEDGKIGMWDVICGTKIMRLELLRAPIKHIAISRDCRQLAAIAEKKVLLWDLQQPRKDPAVHRFCLEYQPSRVDFFPGGRVLVVGKYGPNWEYWLIKDLTLSRNLIRLERHDKCAIPTILPDGKRVASAARNGTVSVWSMVSHKELIMLDRESVPTSSITVSTNGKQLALFSGRKSLTIWDISTNWVRKRESWTAVSLIHKTSNSR